jgi:adenylosuccinate lyase
LCAPLGEYFSEYALIKNRVFIEIEYFRALTGLGLPPLAGAEKHLDLLADLFARFNETEAVRIKEIEKVTNHDVKAVEYYLREKIKNSPLEPYSEFIHFGLTSQDINNTAQPFALLRSNQEFLFPLAEELIRAMDGKAHQWKDQAMLAHTHGQPASPTTLGKEIKVFVERLRGQFALLREIPVTAKFGGATGNFNAHKVSFPGIDWHGFADHFVAGLGLDRIRWTTQIEPYDYLAAYCHAWCRINTILLDFCRDLWMYISMNYISQTVIRDEVGSSAMPHKVNPIDFENAEGNLGIANALFSHLAGKLPISRLQRDLTDSTVLRNLGVPLAHTTIAIKSILKGLTKIEANHLALLEALGKSWVVVAEAIQTILRREGVQGSYELLKELTRGRDEISESDFREFIAQLPVSLHIKEELLQITPFNYTGDTEF